MMYAFHENQLIKQDSYIIPPDVPPYTYVYSTATKKWVKRYERMYFRPLPTKHVPKELRALCLILGIHLG